MSYDNTNTGGIWGNDRKETDRHPDFRGQANIEGVEYWVAAWKRGPNDNPKSPALRFAFTPKDAKPKHEQQPEPDQGGDPLEGDIPFSPYMKGTIA